MSSFIEKALFIGTYTFLYDVGIYDGGVQQGYENEKTVLVAVDQGMDGEIGGLECRVVGEYVGIVGQATGVTGGLNKGFELIE